MPGKLPFQVGLTGGIGSGKTTVARIFHLLKVPVYESDETAKTLYFEPEIKKKVISLLGESAYLSENELNSVWIAGRIYSNEADRNLLNEIIHPAVGRHYQNWLAGQNHPYILKLAALIFEAGIYKNMDLNILVLAPAEIKVERILKRDIHRDLNQIEKIMQSQMQDNDKLSLADLVIYNDEAQSIISQVCRINENLLSKIENKV